MSSTSLKPTVLIVGTLDTKLPELRFIRDQILAISKDGCDTVVLDVGRPDKAASIETPHSTGPVLKPLQDHVSEIEALDRAAYTEHAIAVSTPVVEDLVQSSRIHAIISAAGSTGTSIATALMRNASPIGFPKLMVSTMASGDIKPYIEETDITMMYSVVDIAGLNSILKSILSNAAAAIVGMVSSYMIQRQAVQEPGVVSMAGKRIAVTMFGVTTPCVDDIRRILSSTPFDGSSFEIYVFHATGSGGLAMERLIDEGRIDAVIDLTTTEIADALMGGVLSAGPKRLEAAIRKGIPMVLSVGACDMVNFGPKDTVPDHYTHRKLYVHNPSVTLMRTTADENRKIANFLVEKVGQASDQSRIRVLLPTAGVSAIDAPGQPFHDPEANQALFDTITQGLQKTAVEVQELDSNINDPKFAQAVCDNILDLMGISPRDYRLANARRRQWSFSHGPSIDAVRRASFVKVPYVE